MVTCSHTNSSYGAVERRTEVSGGVRRRTESATATGIGGHYGSHVRRPVPITDQVCVPVTTLNATLRGSGVRSRVSATGPARFLPAGFAAARKAPSGRAFAA